MSQIFTWIKTVSTVLIVLSLFKNLLPGKKYERYLNAFLGMLIVYVLFEPFARTGSLQEVIIDGIFMLEDAQQELYSQEEQEAFSYHLTASEYERLLRMQIAGEAQAAGLDIADVQLVIGEEQGSTYGTIEQVTLVCGTDTFTEEALTAFADRLSQMLGVDQGRIVIE